MLDARAIGAPLIALYAARAPLVWQQELRSVSAGQLRADLAAGDIRAGPAGSGYGRALYRSRIPRLTEGFG